MTDHSKREDLKSSRQLTFRQKGHKDKQIIVQQFYFLFSKNQEKGNRNWDFFLNAATILLNPSIKF